MTIGIGLAAAGNILEKSFRASAYEPHREDERNSQQAHVQHSQRQSQIGFEAGSRRAETLPVIGGLNPQIHSTESRRNLGCALAAAQPMAA